MAEALAYVFGVLFFVFTVGIEKLDPKNLEWLSHTDQRIPWLGWQFFSRDSWHWPLGSNGDYGWEGLNSIVFTDSFPGLAVIGKALNQNNLNDGQYFGFGLLFGSIALFVGAYKLFSQMGFGAKSSVLATVLLATTPTFWWMQRMYPTLSSGVALIVWAVYLYIRGKTTGPLRRLGWGWITLISCSVATQAYLTVMVVAVFLAAVAKRAIERRDEIHRLVGLLVATSLCCFGVMYIFGYFTIPSKWSQTGGYGWYSANILGLIDSNATSATLPDLPSLPGQHEPIALGTGTLILAVVLVIYRLASHRSFGLRASFAEHSALLVTLAGLFLLAVSNTISVGEWSFQIPIPHWLQHGLSVFRSSARFVWPSVVVVTVMIVALTIRFVRYGSTMLLVAVALQIGDYAKEMRDVSERSDGKLVGIEISESFWQSVPSRYTTIAMHPAINGGQGWTECAYAASRSNREGHCGYFSRVQGLEEVNLRQSEALSTGQLNTSTVYWVSTSWLKQHKSQLSLVDPRKLESVQVVTELKELSNVAVILIPNCGSSVDCSMFGESSESLGTYLTRI
ncbi:MAG: hypothetical protein EBZ61_10055 [Micrococcales bacterium]|nr:hypothetical protein [Micrococcales bacterium]